MGGKVHRNRVAVVQLDHVPAALLANRSPLEDPLFSVDDPLDGLKPRDGKVPEQLRKPLEALRRRIRAAYVAQLGARVAAILDTCATWGVEVVAFPEYSVPWELLPEVAARARGRVVVAGSHTVERAAKKDGVYARLGLLEPVDVGSAVAPVLVDGRLMAAQAKLSRSRWEADLVLGKSWAPIALEPPLGGPMGVMICHDFLDREDEAHRARVAPWLESCSFLVTPSLTPKHSVAEFHAHAWEEARRYGRPVLYTGDAAGGGSSIFVDEGRVSDLRAFPDHAGLLDAGDEGLVVADIHLGAVRIGRSTRYQTSSPIEPFAAAAFVYRARARDEAYAQFLASIGPSLDRHDEEALETVLARIAESETLLLDSGALRGAQVRDRRLRRLLDEAGHVTAMASVRRYLRELVMPPGVLPMELVRAALALGAADTIARWARRSPDGLAFAEVERRLRDAAALAAKLDIEAWTAEGRAAVEALVSAVADEAGTDTPTLPAVSPTAALPAGFDLASLPAKVVGSIRLEFAASAADLINRWIRRDDGGLRSGQDGRQVFVEWRGASIHEDLALHQLLLAEGARSVATVWIDALDEPVAEAVVTTDGRFERRLMRGLSVVLAENASGLRHAEVAGPADWLNVYGTRVLEALRSYPGNIEDSIIAVSAADRASRVRALRSVLDGASARVKELRTRALALAQDYVPLDVLATNTGERTPALTALDDWLASPEQIALLLGEYGTGKSTTLAVWAERAWAQTVVGPRPILVSLGSVPSGRDELGMLLDACGLPDDRQRRSAMSLLVEHGFAIPIFDGFDEWVTRTHSGELAGRLRPLLSVGHNRGRVLIGVRDHYFADVHVLDTALRGYTYRVHTLALLTEAQQRAMIEAVAPERAEEIVARIATTYPLHDLADRPLLLKMVLETIDRFDGVSAMSRADLYETYLRRWLEQTSQSELFSPDEKMRFADIAAASLWRLGAETVSPEELEGWIRRELSGALPPDAGFGAAFLEIEGGAFFVKEGDRYRFAHKSFWELFFARYLAAQLPSSATEHVLDTRPISRAVIGFLAEILERQGPKASPAVRAVRAWLLGGRAGQYTTEERLAETAGAAANALRILEGIRQWVGDEDAWVPEGADLRRIELLPSQDLTITSADDDGSLGARRRSWLVRAGSDADDLTAAKLRAVDLRGSVLAAVRIEDTDLTYARLDGVCFDGARLARVDLSGADAGGSSWVCAEGEDVRWTGARLASAQFRQSCWTRCDWRDVETSGVEVTAAVGTGVSGSPVVVTPARVVVAGGRSGRMRGLTWSPDGGRLAVATHGTVWIWRAFCGAPERELVGHEGVVTVVAWAPGGAAIASASSDAGLRIWSADDGHVLRTLKGHKGLVHAVAWASHGKSLASAGDDGTIRIWSADDGRLLRTLHDSEGPVYAVAWAPNGATIASASLESSVRVRSAIDGRLLRTLEGHEGVANDVAWAPDGTTIVSGGDDKTLRIWSAENGRLLRTIEGHEDWVHRVAWAPDGNTIASASNDATIRIWTADDGRLLRTLDGHLAAVDAIAWAPDGATIASASDDGTLRTWSADDGRLLRTLQGNEDWVPAVAWAPGGATIALAAAGTQLRVWSADTARLSRAFQAHQAAVRAVAWAPDAATIASASDDGTLRILSAEDQRLLRTLEGHRAAVEAVAWAPDGAAIVSASRDRTLRIWRTDDGRHERTLEGHRERVHAVAWSPDGASIASGSSDRTVRIWSANDGRLLRTLEGHGAGVYAVAWAPDGASIVSGSGDRTVCIWSADDGRLLRKLEGHQATVHAVAWAPDGASIASGSRGTLRIWSAHDGRVFRTLHGQQARNHGLAWSHDGAMLASAGNGVLIWRWPFDGQPIASLNRSLVRTRGGFFTADPDERLVFATERDPGVTATLFRPLGALGALLRRPDKVAAALAGDLSGDDPTSLLAEHGITFGPPWDGRPVVLPTTATPSSPPRFEPADTASPARNPFKPGPPLDDDAPAGRDDLLQEILALTEVPASVVLLGARRSGKTSLLNALRQRLQPHRRDVYGLMLGMDAIATPDQLALALDPTLGTAEDAAARFKQKLAGHDATRRPVILLDEVGYLTKADVSRNPSVFGWLRGLGQHHAVVVCAGSHKDWTKVRAHALTEPGSSFGNDMTHLEVGPLAEADALRFLRENSPTDAKLDETARWVVARCGTWPFYLQHLAFQVVQRARAGRRQALVDEGALHAVYVDLFRSTFSDVIAQRWNEFDATSQSILLDAPSDLAMFGPESLPAERRRKLEEDGLWTRQHGWLVAGDKPFLEWLDIRRRERGGGSE